jgi:hypothetical protein
MLRFSVNIRDLNFNEAAEKFLPVDLAGILLKAGIRILPAKEQLTAFLINANRDKIIREINKNTAKKSLPLKVNNIQLKYQKEL